MNEIVFEVCEDDDGGYTASALGYGIHTEAETAAELKLNVREAVECFFDKGKELPRIIRLHFHKLTAKHAEIAEKEHKLWVLCVLCG